MLGIIGDIHGKSEEHLRICRDFEFTIQVGDLGLDYGYLELIDPAHHKFIGGNHDNYGLLKIDPPPHYLGDFGIVELDGRQIFFFRGAWSIDRKYRRFGVDWFFEEELSLAKCAEALQLYKSLRPSIVITHECPFSVVGDFSDPDIAYEFGFAQPCIKTRTNVALDEMLSVHRPQNWYFGHYHRGKTVYQYGTEFTCVSECQVIAI